MEKLCDRLTHSLALTFHGCLEKLLLYRLREIAPRVGDALAKNAVMRSCASPDNSFERSWLSGITIRTLSPAEC